MSPFSRRVRLALAHKGLAADLVDLRANQARGDEMRALTPVKTVPVLVDGERVIADSNAIVAYLERAHPARPLWPVDDDEALIAREVCTFVDAALDLLVNAGLRYQPLRDSPQWEAVRAEVVDRAQRLFDALGTRIEQTMRAQSAQTTVVASGWSFADIALYTMIAWLDGLPARAPMFPVAKAVVDLGWSLPPSLSRWAAQHRSRVDVVALDAAQ